MFNSPLKCFCNKIIKFVEDPSEKLVVEGRNKQSTTIRMQVNGYYAHMSEEALRAVPYSYRQGSLALGTTRWQTIWGVVLPAALPAIITGIVLSIGRVVSETAVFYVTLGGSYRLPTSLLAGGRTMALHLYYLAMDTRAFDKAMGTGAILILSIVLVNAVINYLSRRLMVKE